MKTKRRLTKAQVDPNTKRLAIQLKQAGVLSKRANLRKHAVSQHVAKKVAEYGWVAQNHYQAVKAKPEMVAKAKAQGLQTVGNKIIIPKDHVAKKRLSQGVVTGIRAIPGGNMQIVMLPYDSMTSFLMGLQSGDVDRFKQRKEQFAFTFYGNMSQIAFRDSKHLYEWLIKYDAITNPLTGSLLEERDSTYSNFILYRVMPGMWNPPSYEEKRRLHKERRASHQSTQDRRASGRRMKRVSEIGGYALEARREADAKRQKEKRASMTPEKRAEYNRKALERAKRSRARRGKK